MAYWVLPAFLISLGAGPAQLGVIEGLAESVASFAKLFSGYLADRLDRRKPLVVAGYFVANAVKPLLAVAGAWWHILLIRFSDRLAGGVRGAPRDVMVAESVPKQRLGSAYGLIQAMDSAGAIAGPLAALVLLARFGIRSVFWAAAVPGALCVMVALFGIRETQNPHFSRRTREMGYPNQPMDRDPHSRGTSYRSAVCQPALPKSVLYGSDRSDAFLVRQFERYVPGDAGAERRHSRWLWRRCWGWYLISLTRFLVLACRMVQRPLFTTLDRSRRVFYFRGGLFCVRARALHSRPLDHHGGLWFLLRADAARAQGPGG